MTEKGLHIAFQQVFDTTVVGRDKNIPDLVEKIILFTSLEKQFDKRAGFTQDTGIDKKNGAVGPEFIPGDADCFNLQLVSDQQRMTDIT